MLQAALDLSARLLTLEASARRVRGAEDGKAIHDFRVATRRLTAALDLWAPLLDPRSAARTRQRVRRMRRELSPIRDLQVLGTFLRERLAAAPAEARVILEARIARIDRKLASLARRTRQVVRASRIERSRRGLLRAVRRSPAAAVSLRAADLMQARIADTRERAQAALTRAWSNRDDRSLHEARVRIKAWRYARESGEAPESGAPPAEDLRAVQESLGSVQDLAIVMRDLEKRARRARRKERPALAETIEALLEQLAAEKSQAALEAQRRSTTLSVVALRGRTAAG